MLSECVLSVCVLLVQVHPRTTTVILQSNQTAGKHNTYSTIWVKERRTIGISPVNAPQCCLVLVGHAVAGGLDGGGGGQGHGVAGDGAVFSVAEPLGQGNLSGHCCNAAALGGHVCGGIAALQACIGMVTRFDDVVEPQ